MCIRELPNPEKRDEQVLLMTNRVLRGLVRRCLQTDPEARPTMQEIIDELSGMHYMKYFVKMFVVNRFSEVLKMFIAESCVQSFLVTK